MKKSGFASVLSLSASFALCCLIALSLGACSKQKETPVSTEEAAKAAAADPEITGTPDKQAPSLQLNGAVHKGEKLYFVLVGEFSSKDEADKKLASMSEKLSSGNQKNFWTVVASDSLGEPSVKLAAGKFYVAHAYPSQEAIDGYAAKDYAEALADGASVEVVEATFNSDDKIVVMGVDAQ